ncbi:MAG: bifunctional glutamate N-acetyltransferase/amino-acid acetyltransferase ArgJ [Oscillospiraceae bacterium]|jgi:glutamate N-acetyltransferase/amino-acid N-acetyltransferase|nr:bifunctional glutamate N-acetyltransferase/amino-acid acetyltransferase ArgJ [Oscillospiraceae bacterium]
MTERQGGCCAAKGFSASGVYAGVRKNPEKKDLALIYAECDCSVAALYTTNRVKAAPIYVTMRNLERGTTRAIIANSGNANACAPGGEENAQKICDTLAKELGIKPDEIIINSTGVIGVPLPVDAVTGAIPQLTRGLSRYGSDDAANAIMTTDTFAKQVAVETKIAGKTVRIGGIAKGSGMIHPNMATMLAFITTDIAITSEMLKTALTESNRITYNRISVDGDTSTNDMVAILASGLAKNTQIEWKDTDYRVFLEALNYVNGKLAKMIARDGEGATKLVSCLVKGASSEEAAEKLAMSVISSSLVKAAMFGADANWGREICAMGYSKAPFKPELTDISFVSGGESIAVCKDGAGLSFNEADAKRILEREEIQILVDVHDGVFEAEAFGCDLTYEYVRINGDYRT